MSLMMSSCWTLRLKRRRAFSIDSPSCNLISAKTEHPLIFGNLYVKWSRFLRSGAGHGAQIGWDPRRIPRRVSRKILRLSGIRGLSPALIILATSGSPHLGLKTSISTSWIVGPRVRIDTVGGLLGIVSGKLLEGDAPREVVQDRKAGHVGALTGHAERVEPAL